MTKQEFWKIVDKVHRDSNGRMAVKCRLLRKALRKLSPSEIRSFDQNFGECEAKAYDWDVWAAAYVIAGWCSDDMFSDFRATLISCGQATFDRVTKSPTTLIETRLNKKNAFYEGYQYVAGDIFEEMTGNDMPRRAKPHPKKPTGKKWREEELTTRFPELAKKFKFDQRRLNWLPSRTAAA
jgi:hypothetical protein